MGENLQILTDVLRDKLARCLTDKDVTFIVGFSGGRDSLALLWGLHLLAEGEWSGRVDVLAAHFNHNLRGEEATADEEFCREFCLENGIKYVAAQANDLSAEMSNVEQRARQARYAWFASLRQERMRRGSRVYLLTAHHLEDQAETVLLHLLRGSGTTGLVAMREQREWHLRPLLDVPRSVLQGALQEQGFSWQEDSTNDDTDYTRNFIRARIMPIMREVNPQAARALAQVAEVAAGEDAYFGSIIEEKMRLAEIKGGSVGYAWAAFAAEPLAVRRRLVRAMWLAATRQAVCPLSFAQVEAVLGLSAGQSVNLSGAVWAARRGKRLIMRAPSAEELQYRREKSRKGQ